MKRNVAFGLMILLSLLMASCKTPQPTVEVEATATTQAITLAPTTETLAAPISTTPVTAPAPDTATPTVAPNLPSGLWSVRAYNTNDANIILVNEHIAGVAFCCEGDTGWIDISAQLNNEVNYLTFVNVNSATGAKWGFSLSHNDTVVWGNEGESGQPNTLAYVQTLQVAGDDSATAVDLKDPNKTSLAGTWTAQVKADDVGLLLVNGVPVTGGFGEGFGWVDISGLLYAGQNNIIRGMVWNSREGYSWAMTVRNGETIVWSSESSGSGQTGEVLYTTVIIDGDGNLMSR